MKYIVGFARIFVGLLFIFSGLIKLNDPMGFGFKLEEYFAPEVLNLEFLMPFSLWIAIFVVIFEVLLGVMILIGYARKFTVWSLLLMIIFFTFLTFYSAYFEKVTDCGCFGDAIPLNPWQSFWKDIILLVFILILFFGRKYITPIFSKNGRAIIMAASMVGCLWITFHVLSHLPILDFRAYKEGVNITEGMTVPEDALPPIIQYDWTYEIDGKKKVISNTTGMDPQPAGGTFVSVETSFEREPYEPPIHDFTIERDEQDYTEDFLAMENLVAVIAYSLDAGDYDNEGFAAMKKMTDEAIEKGYPVIGMSASLDPDTGNIIKEHDLNFKFYYTDMTTLKTIVRSNPGLVRIQNGTIMQKLHWNDAEDLELPELSVPNRDWEKELFNVEEVIDSVAVDSMEVVLDSIALDIEADIQEN